MKVNKRALIPLIGLAVIAGLGAINWEHGINIKEKISGTSSTHVANSNVVFDGDKVTIENTVPIISDYDSRGEDVKVVPDKYNSGADLTKEMVTPEFYEKQGYFEKRDGDYAVRLQDDIYGEEHIIFENIYFSELPLYFANNSEKSPQGTIEFVNCFFGKGLDMKPTVLKKFIFRNCDFLDRPLLATNSEFYNCKFYKSQGDALQIAQNVKVIDSYIYDNGLKDPEKNHSDGIQIAGFGNIDAKNNLVDNVRIEMPRVAPHYGQNSAMIIKMDLADGYDMEFKNMILNGGAFSLYIVPMEEHKLENLRFENVKIGNNSEWGPLYGNEKINAQNILEQFEVVDSGIAEKVYVSSVRKEKDKIVFCATNETTADRKILVETNKESKKMTVPHVLSVEETKKAKANFDELNIDKEFEIKDADWIKVYDGDELIRYKEFNVGEENAG